MSRDLNTLVIGLSAITDHIFAGYVSQRDPQVFTTLAGLGTGPTSRSRWW